MKQLLQNLRSGVIEVADVPPPQLREGQILVQVSASALSAGTERSSIDFGKKSLVQKAKARPDLVKQVVAKAKREGIATALKAAANRLDKPRSLGYSCAGTVIGVGPGAGEFRTGDRVACAGTDHAVHAEIVAVPQNLAVKIADNVPFESAAFTTLGAIAMHGVRLTGTSVGETVGVIGLGIVGLLTVQILKSSGCQVVGVDFSSTRVMTGLQTGCDAASIDPEEFSNIVAEKTDGLGLDSVIIAASSPTSAAVEMAGEIARDRASIVVVGDVGIDIPRRVYYEKELSVRVARSYGPGRYDSAYEEKGRDYPVSYVRWTENRNMDAFVKLLSLGSIDPSLLVTHRFQISDALQAYELIAGKKNEPFLGVLLTYPGEPSGTAVIGLDETTIATERTDQGPAIGLLGAGAFVSGTLLPTISRSKQTRLVGICSAKGVSGRHLQKKFRFEYCTTDEKHLMHDSNVNAVVIATPHHFHAIQAAAALDAGKDVFLEKPMAINEAQLSLLAQHFKEPATESNQGRTPSLLVGFNRRFSPMIRSIKDFMTDVQEPLAIRCRVNAGFLSSDHWTNDPEIGGGRVIGELCHFVDTLTYLAGARPSRVFARSLGDSGKYSGDNVIAILDFDNGAVGEITYLSNGDRTIGKEHIEVFGGERSAILDDFKQVTLTRDGRSKVSKQGRNNKGHRAEWEAFENMVRSGVPVINFHDMVATTLTTFRIQESIRTGKAIAVDLEAFSQSLDKPKRKPASTKRTSSKRKSSKTKVDPTSDGTALADARHQTRSTSRAKKPKTTPAP